MKEVLEDLESILNQKIVQDFKISSTVRSELGKVSEKKVESTSLVAEDDVIYGRDEDKEMIISWLTSDSDNQYLPSVLSIVGMGGMGKTTLAQHVFNMYSMTQRSRKLHLMKRLGFVFLMNFMFSS